MKLNKKGIGAGMIFIYIVGVNIAISQLPGVRKNFRERKGIEQCVSEGSTKAVCEILVQYMNKKELLAYIRDDDVSGSKGFGGDRPVKDYTNISKMNK